MASAVQQSEIFEAVSYRNSLPSDVRERYDKKTALVSGDPYQMERAMFDRDRMKWPDVSYYDIFHYLVISKNWFTKEQMKHFKSLEAYRFFQDDWIREVLHREVNGFHLMKAKVTHSMRISEKPLQPWIILSSDGVVQSAHCTCMAGLSEACSHIGAVLFCLETCARVRKDATPTDVPAYWLFPSTTKLDRQYKKVKEMDLQSASKHRQQKPMPASLDSISEEEGESSEDEFANIPSPTLQEEQTFFNEMITGYPESSLLTITPGFSQLYTPKSATIDLPPKLEELFEPSLQGQDAASIDEHCSKINLNFNEKQAEIVEKRIRQQTSCVLWYDMRAGRITASNFKAACSANVDRPPVSLLKKICYPSKSTFKSAPTDWGKKNEKTAQKMYVEKMSASHKNFRIKESGLILNPAFPEFGATPDGIISCVCCGEGCLEIKCPYTLRESSSSYTQIDWLAQVGGSYLLKTNHAHYYQVQCQLFLSEQKYCDFVVWAPHLPQVVIRIYADEAFWLSASKAASNFHKKCILPELCAQLFSKPKVLCVSPEKAKASTSRNSDSYCICGGPDDGQTMIMCENENCKIVWYHTHCLQMKRIPKGRWVCKECKINVQKKKLKK